MNNFIVFVNGIKLIADNCNCELEDADPETGIVSLKGSKEDKREVMEGLINLHPTMHNFLFMTLANLVADVHGCRLVRVDLENHWIEFDGEQEAQEDCFGELESIFIRFSGTKCETCKESSKRLN